MKEPLLHFFVFGAIVFGASLYLDPDSLSAEDDRLIEITEDDIFQMVVAWRAQGRPDLTRDQLQSLLDHKIAEEVLFREGIALGLDRNDEIIKRRVAQKMDFLAADIAALQEPEADELAAWFDQRKDRFALPPRASFRHLYFSPDERGDAARSDAVAALQAIAGTPPGDLQLAEIADPFMLRSYYGNTAPQQLLKEFGPEFARELFELEPGDWRGPVRSGYGWHLVWLETVEPGRIPVLDEVAEEVRSAWRNERYREIKQTALDEMRSLYEISVPDLDAFDPSDFVEPGRATAVEGS